MKTVGLMTKSIITANDIFALRHSARTVAEAMGYERADQVRLATALSELGRETIAHGGRADAVFRLSEDGTLFVDIEGFPHTAALNGVDGTGIAAARKLIDVIIVSRRDDATDIVTLRRDPPKGSRPLDLLALRRNIEYAAAPSPLEALRLENRNLVATLEDLKAQSQALKQLNDELEETNRGVVAMYTQLADELEETNRGVVALYAELDDKTHQLNSASEAKSRFLTNASHELRSPLNSILGLARLLLDSQDCRPEQCQQLELLLKSANLLLGLVNQLLDLAKAESGKLRPEPSPLDLREVFSELQASMRPLAMPEVELKVETPPISIIETDRSLLVQILRNLLSNALKFTVRGNVSLSAQTIGSERIEMSVCDTGIGIAPEDQERIFEEFYQVRGPLQKQHKGTGLGLSYARRIARTLGGDIALRSEPGRGSVFTLTLPLTSHVALPPNRLVTRRLGATNVGTVLVIDDDEAFRVSLRGMLQGVASRIVEASGGIEGLKTMRALRPDLVFLDLRMPDMDGKEVLMEMSCDNALREVPVILVSSLELSTQSVGFGPVAGLLAKANLSKETLHDIVAEVATCKQKISR